MSHLSSELGRRRWWQWQWDTQCVNVVYIRHSSARGRLRWLASGRAAAVSLVSAWVSEFTFPLGCRCCAHSPRRQAQRRPKRARCLPPGCTALPAAMAAVPTQLCHLRSASHVALADDPLSRGIPANLLTGRCLFHKAAVKTKKTKNVVLFYTH